VKKFELAEDAKILDQKPNSSKTTLPVIIGVLGVLLALLVLFEKPIVNYVNDLRAPRIDSRSSKSYTSSLKIVELSLSKVDRQLFRFAYLGIALDTNGKKSSANGDLMNLKNRMLLHGMTGKEVIEFSNALDEKKKGKEEKKFPTPKK
jgi:hypothetical protein